MADESLLDETDEHWIFMIKGRPCSGMPPYADGTCVKGLFVALDHSVAKLFADRHRAETGQEITPYRVGGFHGTEEETIYHRLLQAVGDGYRCLYVITGETPNDRIAWERFYLSALCWNCKATVEELNPDQPSRCPDCGENEVRSWLSSPEHTHPDDIPPGIPEWDPEPESN